MNKRDVEGLYLEARADVQEWTGELLQAWYAEEMDMLLLMFWSSLDPAVKAQLQANNPAAYRQAEGLVREAADRMKLER